MGASVIEACTEWEAELLRRQQALLRREDLALEPKVVAGRGEPSPQPVRQRRPTNESPATLRRGRSSELAGKGTRETLWAAFPAEAPASEVGPLPPPEDETDLSETRLGGSASLVSGDVVRGGALSNEWHPAGPQLVSTRPVKENIPPSATVLPGASGASPRRNSNQETVRAPLVAVGPEPSSHKSYRGVLANVAGASRADHARDSSDRTDYAPLEAVSALSSNTRRANVCRDLNQDDVRNPSEQVASLQTNECHAKIAGPRSALGDRVHLSPSSPTRAVPQTICLALEWHTLHRQMQHELSSLELEIEQARSDRERLARDALAIVSGCRQWWLHLESETRALAQARADLERDAQIFREFTTSMQRHAVRTMQQLEERFHRCVDVWQQELTRRSSGPFPGDQAQLFQNGQLAAASMQLKSNAYNDRLTAGMAPSTAPDAPRVPDIVSTAGRDAGSWNLSEQHELPDAEQRWMRRFVWLQQELLGLRQQLAEDSSDMQRQAPVTASTTLRSSTARRSCIQASSLTPHGCIGITEITDRGDRVTPEANMFDGAPTTGNEYRSLRSMQDQHERCRNSKRGLSPVTNAVSEPVQISSSWPSQRGTQSATTADLGAATARTAVAGQSQAPSSSVHWSLAGRDNGIGTAMARDSTAKDTVNRGDISTVEGRPPDALAVSPWMTTKSIGRHRDPIPEAAPTGIFSVAGTDRDQLTTHDVESAIESPHRRLRQLRHYVDLLRQRTTDPKRQAQLATLHALLNGLEDPSRSQALALDHISAYIASLVAASPTTDTSLVNADR
ncbi:hypothetical protein CCYA_CCYA11G3192 [Cyanidiococcus yangmingshanensis]|nr:hypothetical protein CCYA_CCYA11G3192 [Cyanidiococcus yangmingshanensis]